MWHGFAAQPLTFASSAHSKSAHGKSAHGKCPARRACDNQQYTCRSVGWAMMPAGDHDPVAVLLTDRMNAAETRHVVARRNSSMPSLRAWMSARWIDVAHRPAASARVCQPLAAAHAARPGGAVLVAGVMRRSMRSNRSLRFQVCRSRW